MSCNLLTCVKCKITTVIQSSDDAISCNQHNYCSCNHCVQKYKIFIQSDLKLLFMTVKTFKQTINNIDEINSINCESSRMNLVKTQIKQRPISKNKVS